MVTKLMDEWRWNIGLPRVCDGHGGPHDDHPSGFWWSALLRATSIKTRQSAHRAGMMSQAAYNNDACNMIKLNADSRKHLLHLCVCGTTKEDAF